MGCNPVTVEEMIGPRGVGPDKRDVQVGETSGENMCFQEVPLSKKKTRGKPETS